MTSKELMKRLESLASHDPKDLAGMARFGINVDKAWVISIPKLRQLAKEIKSSVIPAKAGIQKRGGSLGLRPGMTTEAGMTREGLHQLALQVWDTEIHEAKILAGLMDVPELVTEDQMEKWVLGFDSWDVTDMVCGNLFDRTEFAIKKAIEWSSREEVFVKRAGFVLMAGLAVHNKILPDDIFIDFLSLIERESADERNFVRKAVNWALRAIGKTRNEHLYHKALAVSRKLYSSDNKTARWIGSDATRELEKEYIAKRFN